MRKLKLFFLLLLCSSIANAKGAKGNLDSLVQFSLHEFLDIVIANHPVVKQAEMLDELASAELMYARGFFDPKLESTFDAKRFQEKNYFRVWDNVLKIPVWTNTDLKIGYERNSGVFLNDENSVPENGLLYAGISVPIGQGLFIDSRRATLRQAQIFQDMAEAEKVKEINKILLTAAKNYWDWYYTYSYFRLIEEGVELAEQRYSLIKNNVRMGDYAPIDSVEARITVQTRRIELSQAEVDLNNSRLSLSIHLWNDEERPVEIREEAYPEVDENDLDESIRELPMLIELARENHPEIIKVNRKIEQLEVERRLNMENLKPVINLNYNFLNQPGNDLSNPENNIFRNDYKLAVDFAFPLFLRKERAKLQKTNIKLYQTNFDRIQIRRDLLNEIAVVYNELENMEDQIQIQQAMVKNYEKLLQAEWLNFRNGLSSVFMVNSRESKLIESRAKLLALQTKLQKNKATLHWASGLPYLDYTGL